MRCATLIMSRLEHIENLQSRRVGCPWSIPGGRHKIITLTVTPDRLEHGDREANPHGWAQLTPNALVIALWCWRLLVRVVLTRLNVFPPPLISQLIARPKKELEDPPERRDKRDKNYTDLP